WRWARRRHPKKNQRWIKKKYFAQSGTRNWIFTGEMRDDQGQPFNVWLLSASATPIRRHVKVRSDANPYDPAYETYFVVTWKLLDAIVCVRRRQTVCPIRRTLRGRAAR